MNTLTKWVQLTHLNLLDDTPDFDFPAFSPPKIAPPRPAAEAKVPAAKPLDAQKTSAIKALSQKAPERVFSANPSLRDMMHDYNRRGPKTSPIKAPMTSSQLMAAFQPSYSLEMIENIQIPSIPGKILRPVDADS